jgi:photosynthetic reaction center cytochrome c subunit
MPNSRWKRTVLRIAGASLVCLIGIVSAAAQTAPEQKPPLAEDVFKNVQVLRGISVDEFMGTMGFFSAALGMNCVECHTADSVGNWAKFADDTPLKQTARRMILMVKAINQANFSGARKVTCYSCHRGLDLPEVTPSLAEQYGTPPDEDPDKIKIQGEGLSGPSADQILDRYIQALGGAQQLARLTSFTAKGTYAGYETDTEEVPVEIFAKAPNLRTTIVHTRLGSNTYTYDGRQAWVAAIDEPLPLLALSGGELAGARVDAALSIPTRIKQDFTNWRAGFPSVNVNGHTLQVVEGNSGSDSAVKLYFDKDSGLLVRQVRFTNTVVGLIPTHIEYSDYRTVAGVKLPFHWVTTWTHNQSTTQLTEVQPNSPIDAAKFAKPAPANPPKPVAK